jgi:hypothetical protein
MDLFESMEMVGRVHHMNPRSVQIELAKEQRKSDDPRFKQSFSWLDVARYLFLYRSLPAIAVVHGFNHQDCAAVDVLPRRMISNIQLVNLVKQRGRKHIRQRTGVVKNLQLASVYTSWPPGLRKLAISPLI